MDSWSKTSKNPADAELLHCILIVKGDASQILKKVSIALSYKIHLTSNFYRFNQSLKSYAPYHFEVFKQEELLVMTQMSLQAISLTRRHQMGHTQVQISSTVQGGKTSNHGQ